MSQHSTPPDQHTVLDDAWSQVVGGMDWLKSVIFGEFADHRSLSAVVADMLISFLPGVVIVTSARDAVAVVLRLANHPEKRVDLMEWVLLCACLIVIALPLAMAAGGLAVAGVGAIVGGLAGTELGAALRAVMLMLIKEATKLVELVQFLQKFIKGDILKFLRAVKFAKYEKAVVQALSRVSGKLAEMVKALRIHLESLRYFDAVKASIVRLAEWEKKFYNVQQDAMRQIPKALAELDARLGKVLAQTAPKEAHTVVAGVQVNKANAAIPAKQRIKDIPGKVFAKVEDTQPTNSRKPRKRITPERASEQNPPHETPPPQPPPKEHPEPVQPHDEGNNTKKQEALDAEAVAQREKAAKISEKIGSDIKNHPLRMAYETEVVGLKEEATIMAKAGATDEMIARKMWERRREIGVKYKDLTPDPLRDYIYEINIERYADPLGPSFESLVKSAEKKMFDPYQKIIKSSSTPNNDINSLLSKFENWLVEQDSSYINVALHKLGI